MDSLGYNILGHRVQFIGKVWIKEVEDSKGTIFQVTEIDGNKFRYSIRLDKPFYTFDSKEIDVITVSDEDFKKGYVKALGRAWKQKIEMTS